MSWFSENKFLVGFIATTAVGVGVLGYLTLSASDKYAEAQSEYEKAATELTNLQTQRPFPNQANLKLVEAQKAQALEAVHSLQRELSGSGFSMTDMSASAFQLELKKTIDALTVRAGQSGLNLTGGNEPGAASRKFDLGFEYLSQLPDETAAKPLSRQLKAIDWVVNQLVENGASQLISVTRTKVDEEKEPGKAPPQPKKGANTKQTAQAEPKKLFQKDQFEIKFMAEQPKARVILNKIVGSKEQFFVLRKLMVRNEKENAPSKADAANNSTAPAPVAGAEGAEKPAEPKMTYVLGEEQVVMTLNLEALYFPEPEAAPVNPVKSAGPSGKPPVPATKSAAGPREK